MYAIEDAVSFKLFGALSMIIPVTAGIINPPKKSRIHSRMPTTSELLTNGIGIETKHEMKPRNQTTPRIPGAW